jgi:hypothetical protein
MVSAMASVSWDLLGNNRDPRKPLRDVSDPIWDLVRSL